LYKLDAFLPPNQQRQSTEGNQSINQFIVIRQLEGCITQSEKY